MAIAEDLQSCWYGDGAPPWWTRPLAVLYGGVTALRRGMYRHGWLRSKQLPVPVIVVGNIIAGGAGKTPLAIALVEALRARGFKPGVVSLGVAEQGVGLAMDDNNKAMISADAAAAVDAATKGIADGSIKVHDYMADSQCP